MVKNSYAETAIQECRYLIEHKVADSQKISSCQRNFRLAARQSFDDEQNHVKDEAQIIYSGALALVADVLYCSKQPFAKPEHREAFSKVLDILEKDTLTIADEGQVSKALITRGLEHTVPLEEHPFYKFIQQEGS